jgi:2-dehydro-3-deoxy-D-gluconate 5-dehydrogenase
MFELTGKVAVVTGASRGIGAAISIGLVRQGASVLLVSRTPPDASVIAALEATGQPFAHHAADLSRVSSVTSILSAVMERFGRIDILVNNAGIIRRAPFLDHTEQDWDDVITTNLKVPVFLAQAAAHQMVAQGVGGKIVNVCSMLSYQGGLNVLAYTSAKHGLAGATRAMANELIKVGINVNGLAPGYIETDNTSALRQDAARSESILRRIPAARWGQPDDLVGAAVFLCSSAANYLSGHILNVDGGWMAS